jgi:hypothetical protein
VIPISKSPKVSTQITSQKYRKPPGIGNMVVKMAVTIESSPAAVKKHKSASPCFSDTFTPGSEPGLRYPVNGDFGWSSVFIELISLVSVRQKAQRMPDQGMCPKLLISSEFSKKLTIFRTANLRRKFRELV